MQIQVPFFPGFYESILSQALDNAVTCEAENLSERESSQEYYPDEYWPEPLRLDHSDLWQAVDYRAAYEQMAADWCSALDDWLSDTIDTKPGSFTYESMDSPRYYNFMTDRVYITASLELMQRLYDQCDKTRLSDIIKSRHTSRSGFISHYSNSLPEWQEKPLGEWDHNELGTLLCAVIPEQPDEWELCESIMERDYEYLDRALDWQKYESDCEQARAEKFARWIESDCEAAYKASQACERIAALVPLAMEELSNESREEWEAMADIVPYRCPFTMELPE